MNNRNDDESELVARLRPRLDGKRALLLRDRETPAVESELGERLGLRVIWMNSRQPRKRDAAKTRITTGGCDLVLVVDRFVGHAVDNLLKPACRQHGVPFVLVGNGQTSTILRALAAALLEPNGEPS